jgi:hypothetical protein
VHLTFGGKGRQQMTMLHFGGRDRLWSNVILLRILAPFGLFYRPCMDDEEAVEVMKRYASRGWDSKVVGIKAEDEQFIADSEYYVA